MPTRRVCALALSICACVLLSDELFGQGPVTYVYDGLGRLVGVVDGSGESAVYNYDAVGNLLSIERHSASTVSILQFTPNGGPSSASVTVYGTGFSSTPSQNTVTFNGATAEVVSSTATQIITTVPAAATSGTIAVTTPLGSATSSTAFTVGSPGAPTISSFTPQIGVAGTAVTISGTNFETVAANNRTKFNGTYAAVSSSSATNVSSTVPPQTASGRIAVSTPAGTATGDDFFIPPSPYTATDVGFTGRVTPGQSITVSLAANKIGLVVFDAVGGQRVSLRGTNGTITGYVLGCDAPVSIIKPDTSVLPSSICMEGSGFMDATVLPVSGTYTVLVDPAGTAAGNLTLTLYDVPADISGTITAGGSTVTVTTTAPGQNGVLTFSGTANQRISLRGTNGMWGQVWLTCDVDVTIRKPDGTTLATACMEDSGYIDVTTLPSTGTYSILVNPNSNAMGSLTLTLYSVPADITGTISAGGSAVTITTTAAGQNGTLTFSGTANQRISLRGTNGMWGQVWLACDVTATIRKPDGTTLAAACMEDTGFIDVTTLPTTGTYSILIDPASTAVGSVTVTLYDVPADINGSITPGGSAVTVTATAPGQNGALTFSGTASHRVSLRGTEGVSGQIGFACDLEVTIRKPDGSTLAISCMEGSGYIDVTTLPTTGTYSILVNPITWVTGSVTLTLYDVPGDVSGSLTVNGSAVGVTVTAPGQKGALTLSGTQSQQITVRLNNNTMGSVAVILKRPDGSTLTQSSSSAGSFNLSTQTLPSTGTYTVSIDPSQWNTGSIDVSVTNP